MYPIFELVTRIVLTVVFAVSLFGLGIGLAKTGFSGADFLSQVGGWAAGLFSGLTAALGNIVLVFAIIERTQASKEFEKEAEDWDPAELTLEPDPDQIKRADFIATIVFTVLGLVILNLYPDVIAIHTNTNGVWTSTPILTDAFFSFLPWINLMGIVQIGFSAFMLTQSEWKPITRILSMLVDVAGAVLAVVILTTPDIFSFTAETWGMLEDPEAAKFLTQFFEFIPKMIAVIIVVATIVKVVQTIHGTGQRQINKTLSCNEVGISKQKMGEPNGSPIFCFTSLNIAELPCHTLEWQALHNFQAQATATFGAFHYLHPAYPARICNLTLLEPVHGFAV